MSTIFPREALAAAGHKFEQARGQRIQLADFDEILDHKLSSTDPDKLAKNICDSLTSAEADKAYRQSAYFVLGKKCDEGLLPFFNQQLQSEADLGDADACYQILIALDNLDVDAFPAERDETSVTERDLNMRDAKAYLATL